jgi:hypothetical protein
MERSSRVNEYRLDISPHLKPQETTTMHGQKPNVNIESRDLEAREPP